MPITLLSFIKLSARSLTPFIVFSLLACTDDPNNLAKQTVAEPTNAELMAAASQNNLPHVESKSSNERFKTIGWDELIPPDELELLLNPPAYIDQIEDGSQADVLVNELQNAIVAAQDNAYQQALISTRIIEKMNGQAVRIPGFIVPLEFNDDQTVTHFFLVPYFGACLHMPPPPPNQIVFVEATKGIKLELLNEPYWISGELKTELFESQMATSAYTMVMDNYEHYYLPAAE